MELVKKGRGFLSLPSRWCPLTILALGFVGFGFAIFAFKPRMLGLPPPIASLQSSSSFFGNRISTLFIPGSLDFHASPQQAKVLVPSSAQAGSQYPCMARIKQSARTSYSKDLQALNADMEASPPSPQHHCIGVDRIDIMPSSTKLKSLESSKADDRRHAHHNTFPSVSTDGEFAKCDMYRGKWIEDDMYPLYKPDTCPYVDKKFNCQQNGRPDTKYTRWRWAPRDCKLPRFSGRHMLESLRGKRLAFVGDSLNRNQWESMLCMLRESLANQSRIYRWQGSNRILKFLDYNCTVEFYKSRYLVDMKEGSNETKYVVRLDTMDKSETKWRKADVLIFNTGHWWGPGKLGKGENRFQEGDKVYDRLDVIVAYKKALSTWGQWVDTHVDPHGTRVFFRTFSPQHFRGGQWNLGGHCEDEREPIHEELHVAMYLNEMQALEEVIGAMKMHVHVLNVTDLSAYRKDAHPSVYWHPQNLVLQQQDCGHWCLPGLPDTWNELLYFALVENMPIST